MRLKLNRTLRAALIAAISTMGLTLSQAQAEQQTSAIFNFGNDDISTHRVGETFGYLWGEAGGIQATITATGVLSNYTYAGTAVSYDTDITDATFGAFTTQNVLDTKGTLVSANKGTLTLTLTGLEQGGKYNVALLTGYSPSDSGKWNYLETSNDYVESHFAMGPAAEKVAKANPSGYEISSIKANSDGEITITVHANGSHRTTFFGVALDYVPSKTLTWAGTSDNHVWQSTGVWEDGKEFSSGDDVTFGSTAQSNIVTINSPVQAGGVTVEGQDYTFDFSGEGSMAATSLAVTTNLTLSGSGSIIAKNLTISDGKMVSIAQGATVTTDSRSGSGKISGAGTFQLNRSAIGDVTINADDFTGIFVFNESKSVGQHDTSIIADDGFSGILEIRGRIRTSNTNFGNAQKVRFVGDRNSNNTGIWSNNAASWAKEIEITGTDAVQFELSNTMTLTGALSGEGTLMTTNNSTLNIQGGGTLGTLYAKAGNANGRVNITNNALTLGHLYAGGGTINIGTTVTTGQVRLSENGINDVVVSVNEGGILNVTGTENGHNTSASLLLAHWGQASTLKLNSGAINAAGTEMHLSWTGTGTFEALSGAANVLGIDGQAQSGYKGAFKLGTADSGDAIVVLGATGMKNMSGSVVLELGNGTLGASADWSLSSAQGQTAATAKLIGTGIGTIINTTDAANAEVGRTITFNNATTGAGKLTVAGKGKLVLNGGGDRTGDTSVQGEATLEVNNAAALGTGAVNVAEGASMTVNGGTLSTAITNSGNVVLTNTTLNADKFEEETSGSAFYALDGTTPTTENGNYYVGTAETYVQVVNNSGQAASATGSGIVWGSNTYDMTAKDNGRIIIGQGSVDFDTFYVNTDSVSVSAIDAAGHSTKNVVLSGGELQLDQETSLGIMVSDFGSGTITGAYADATKIGLGGLATAEFAKPVEAGGVKFTAAAGETVSVTNMDEAVSGYSIGNTQLIVGADTLEMTKTDGDVLVSNYLQISNLVNVTGNKLTLNNQDTLVLNNMNITGSTVELVYTGEQMAPVEGTVQIFDTLTAGEATLKADLTLYGGSTLNVDGGGDIKALTLGSILTFDFTDGGLVNLDEETIAALNNLEVGQNLVLVKALQGTELGYNGALLDAQWYSDLFKRTDALQGDYRVYATTAGFGLTKVNNVPEPTTGTLSLLALMALAARRRKR